MATEKILNTRIQLKYDSYANWTSNNPTLKSGELAIAYLGPTHTTTTPDNSTHPVLFKVGPGAFNSLPWASALAADVYAWAKKENPDWTDFPALPIEVIVNGSGRFVTDVEYSENKVTITHSDVNWSDVKNAPDFALKSELPTDFGVLSVEAADASLEVTPTDGDVKAKAKLSAVANNILRLESDGLYVPAPEALPSVTDAAVALSFVTEVDQTDGAIASSKAALVQGANITLTQAAAGGDITIAGKDWSSEIATAQKAGTDAAAALETYKTSNDAAVASKADKSVVEAMYTNSQIDGFIQAAKDYADANDADTKYGISYDKDNKKIKLVENGTAAEIDATDFIKDGMIESVAISEDGSKLVITWNTDAGKEATEIPLSELADIYTGVDGTTINVNVSADDKISAEVKTNSLTDGHIAANAAIAKSKLAADVQTSLGLADTALQAHQDISHKADKVASAVAGNFAGLDANGNLTDSGSKAADFATAAQGTKADNAAAAIATYGDIVTHNAAEFAPANIDTGVHSVALASGSNNGTLKLTVDGVATDNVAVTGLGSAAFTESSAYATSAQGTKADSALQEITTTENGGLKVTNKNQIDIDDSVVFVFNCGSSTEVI